MSSALADRQILPPWESVLAPYSLGYRIKLLSQLMGRQFQEQLDPFGLTPFHWVVLCCLWEQDGLATSAIGERLQQVGATLTGVIDRMEERGVVRRERDRHDRRIWRIWLTEEGRNLRDVLVPIVLGVCDRAFQGVSQTERQRTSEMVDRIIANLSHPSSPNHVIPSDEAQPSSSVLS
ncbi:MAG TPA: MarR family winged helix-turn-helix transcriptional regulator [Crinalium sp.]|jgi:DNA-binding MarR family transcriptional regulator